MTIKAMYHSIAKHAQTANRFGSISESHHCAIQQIKSACIGGTPNYKVLDLGVGDGSFLLKLSQFLKNATFTGIDVSKDMLRHAESILPINTIEANAIEASHYLPNHSQDLVLAHFINAYIPIDTLFREANLLTRANGYFSLITTTYESFPVAQKRLADFIADDSLLSGIVGHFYKGVVKNTTVAAGEDELLSSFRQQGFQIVSHTRLQVPIVLYDVEELAQFGIEGTWFLNSLSIRMLPKKFLLQRLQRLFNRIFDFPYYDTHIIDVILAKK